MKSFDKIMSGIERKTGLTSSEIKNTSPGDLRDYLTRKMHRPFSVTTEFPKIGRGNVLRDGIISSSQINREIDKILGV